MVAFSKYRYKKDDGPWKTIPTDKPFNTPADLQGLLRSRPDVGTDKELLYVVDNENFPFDVLKELSDCDQHVLVLSNQGTQPPC